MNIFANKAFLNPIDKIISFSDIDFKKAFEKIEQYRNNKYLLGYIRYEAKEVFLNKKYHSNKPLLYFEVYDNYTDFSPNEQSYNHFLKLEPTIEYNQYYKAISSIKNQIENGNTYQVNYTLDFKLETKLSGFELYNYLLGKQTTLYNSYIKNDYDELLCFSPELFFSLKNNIIKTLPMKGTVKRGLTEQEDISNIEFLKNDEKNRAENLMIVDLIRNDIGKIAKTASVQVNKLFNIETHSTLHQMTSEIEAELPNDMSVYQIFEALFPCGSITGAPKVSTMNIIDELELGKRNVYCGAIGLISPEEITFNVPIRTLQKKSNLSNDWIYRAGGGIVWDSDIQEEWQECLLKTNFLRTNKDFKIVETILVKNGQLTFYNEHIKRMKNSAKFFGFNFNEENIKYKCEKDGILRLLLDCNGSVETEFHKLTPIINKKVKVSKAVINKNNNFLNHKTTYRPWYEKTKEQILNNELFDEIFLNQDNEITEGSRTNIIIKKNGNMYTPPLSCGILNGIYRSMLVKEGNCIEKKLKLSDLESADTIYCCNSVRGLVEVELESTL